MIRRAYAIWLLSFVTLGFASLPAQAQDAVNTINTSGQTANQAVVINGDRNKVKLRIIQVNTTNGQSPTDNLSQQRVNQSTVIDGNGNRVKMQVRQVNAYNERNRRFHHNNGNNENEDRNRRHNRNQRNRHNKWQ
jgi:hypothetical protein